MSVSRNIAFAVGGSLVSRVLQFVAIILSARFLSPGEFAAWPLFLIITQIPSVIGLLRLDIAITIARSEASAVMLARFTFAFSVLIATLTTIGAYAIDWLSPGIFGLSLGVALLPLIFLHIVGSNVTAVQQSFLTRTKQFRSFAIQSVVASGSTLALILLSQALAGLDVFLFILCQVVGILLGVLVGCLNTRTMITSPLRLSSLRARTPQLLRKYRAYPLLYTPYSLSQAGQERLVNYLVLIAFGAAALGKFFLVRQLFVATANLFAQPLRQLLFSYLVREQDRRAQSNMLSSLLALILATSAPLLFALPAIIQPLLVALAGDEWQGLGVPIFWMSWIAWVTVSVAWIDRVFDVVWKQKTAVLLQIVSDLVILAALALAVALALPFDSFVAIYSIMVSAYYLLWASLALHSYDPVWSHALRPPLGAAFGIGCGLAAQAAVDQFVRGDALAVHCLIFAAASLIALVSTSRALNLSFNSMIMRK